MSTTTPNYNLVLPTPNSPTDANIWGTLLNSGTFTPIDTYLKTTALSNISNTAPTIPTGAPLAGQAWIDTNSSSTTAWYTKLYDGAQWVTTGTINPTTHTFTAAGTGSGSAVNIVTFTSTGTYTPSSGMTKCVIECWGGGGGGGGSAAGGIALGGGGAGSYSQTLSTAASIGSSKTVTIGTGGSGGAATGSTSATAGGTTSVGSLCIANGGSGRINSTSYGGQPGASGGTAGTGNVIAIPGEAGNGATYWWDTGDASQAVYNSGRGGSTTIGSSASSYGFGSTYSPTGTTISPAGANAVGYGAGGGGATTGISPYGTNNTGGNGGPGFVRITEYFG